MTTQSSAVDHSPGATLPQETDTEALLTVEVVYALPDRQKIVELQVAPGATVYEVAMQSQMSRFFPELDIASANMGIFGKAVRDPKVEVIQQGQRVEIYRPLIADPKAVRAKRAAQAKAKKNNGDS